MKAIVIYTSIHHGNTKKVAEVIAKALKAKLVDLTKATPNISKYDLIGFGSGIYFYRHHKKLLEFVDNLPCINKKAFIFSTKGAGSAASHHRALRRRLLNKGLKVVGEFSCKGWDTYTLLKLFGGINKGHPDKEDLMKAERFAKSLKKAPSSIKTRKRR
jgi:flavodoxin